MIILIKPKFLNMPFSKLTEIIELKIKYKYKNIKYLNVSFFKKLKSLRKISKIIKETSINKILPKEIEDPKIIAIGIKENKIKKYFSINLFSIFN